MIFTLLYRYKIFPFLVDFNQVCLKLCKTFLSTVNKLVIIKLLNYIEKSAVYNPTQSGFRKGHPRTTLPQKFRSDIRKALNRNEITISVLIDYSKVFDTNHKTLLEELVSLIFSNRTIKIIMSYLTNRHQYVQIDDQTSPKSPVHFGVSQGSILGPILFNIYVAGLPSCIDSDSIQHADDTTIYRTCRPSDILQEIHILENDIKTASKWSAGNGLVFNNDKLKYITFSSKRKVNDKSYLIPSNRKSIAEETTVKLLGVNFDQNLTWPSHANSIVKASYGILRTLKTFKRFTPFKIRKSLAVIGAIKTKLQ